MGGVDYVQRRGSWVERHNLNGLWPQHLLANYTWYLSDNVLALRH